MANQIGEKEVTVRSGDSFGFLPEKYWFLFESPMGIDTNNTIDVKNELIEAADDGQNGLIQPDDANQIPRRICCQYGINCYRYLRH